MQGRNRRIYDSKERTLPKPYHQRRYKTRPQMTNASFRPLVHRYGVFGIFLSNLGYVWIICFMLYYLNFFGSYHAAVWAILAVFEVLRLCFGCPSLWGPIAIICVGCWLVYSHFDIIVALFDILIRLHEQLLFYGAWIVLVLTTVVLVLQFL